MRISELSSAADLPVGTIKYYLREGLLPPGERTSRTTARYDRRHLDRLRLVRALMDPGGLGIEQIRSVLAVIDAEHPARRDVLAAAQHALLGGDTAGGDRAGGEHEAPAPARTRAQGWAARRGWFTYPGDLVIARLERAWAACEDAGIDVDETVLDRYAGAMEEIARIDVDSVPPGADDAAHRVIVGTVMVEPVLAALRLLAQRQVAIGETGTEP